MASPRQRIGVRELRQSLSVYLGRIAENGVSYEVTDRGRPVAILAPLPDTATASGRLAASGRATLAQGDLLELASPSGAPSRRLSRALGREREDRL